LPSGYVSTRHATLRRTAGRWQVEDNSKNGTFVNGARVDRALLDDGDVIELASSIFLRFRAALGASEADLGGLYSDAVRPRAEGLRPRAQALLTLMPALQHSFQQRENIARSPVSVVLRGETGTGKEVIGRAIHALSGRRGDFVAVNCGAIPDTLIESELFGYKKGAFSGATEDRPGLIRAADRGTLLLDEVGDLPLQSQAALLRVL